MPILDAEIQVAGVRAPFAAGSFSFWQLTDYQGRPSTDVHLGLIKLTLVGEAASWPIWEEWMLDSYRRQSGRLVFYHDVGQTAKTVVFYDAFCVHYECRFDARGQDGQAAFETIVYLSAAAEEVQGQFSEAHSVLPWNTDQATRLRALTKPPEHRPSKELAAAAKTVSLLLPADWVDKDSPINPWVGKARSKSGFLGSPKLTRKELNKWTNRIAAESDVKLEILQKGSPILAYMDANNKQGGFQAEAKVIYLRPGPTRYEVAHEAKHAEQCKQMGLSLYVDQSRLQKEMYVYEELMKSKATLSPAEVEHATAYINRLRKDDGLPPINS
ncbi:type VI secretion system tube protein TssD [Hymenobacter cellulosivorans]|uniref:Tox-MPTase4 domain-containing protein n=1 Tax=Hymenobacter cellulosivorans TaxID=2932249 RepID=A0ABY4FA28_9BACT|nr:type VI secretion system tube protein TssD [Hymenobacter cellulosivorans]UOQ53527.1 hypothetical protein MUN80_01925 [Hymenobacter cellulosivorans]